MSEIQQRQQALMPTGDLSPYAGKWIAVRDGQIVASDINPERLREHQEVRADDALMPIGHPDRIQI